MNNGKIITFDGESDNYAKFCEIASAMAETYRRKNSDYGNAYESGFELFGYTQLLSRIHEKFCRVYNLMHNQSDRMVADESVIDTLTDMASQCVILRMMVEAKSRSKALTNTER